MSPINLRCWKLLSITFSSDLRKQCCWHGKRLSPANRNICVFLMKQSLVKLLQNFLCLHIYILAYIQVQTYACQATYIHAHTYIRHCISIGLLAPGQWILVWVSGFFGSNGPDRPVGLREDFLMLRVYLGSDIFSVS